MAKKVIRDASKEYEKLEKVLEGVAASLDKTTKSQRRSNDAVTKGVTGVRNLRNQVKKTTKETDKGSTAWTKYGRKLSIARSRMLIVAFAGRMVANTLGQMFMAAAKQEQAEIKLASALGRTSKELLNHASAMQRVTRFGDENVIAAQANIAAFIKDEEIVKSLTEATLDLASAKGMDLVTASDLIAKSVGSSTNALSRYGISAIGVAKSTERAESVVRNISTLYGGQAKAQAESYAGTVDGMKNAIGDAAEAIGDLLAPIVIVLANGLKSAANVIEQFSDGLTSLANRIGIFLFGMHDLGEASFDYSDSLKKIQSEMDSMTWEQISAEVKQLNEFQKESVKANTDVKDSIQSAIQPVAALQDNMRALNDGTGDIVATSDAMANAMAQEVIQVKLLNTYEKERIIRQAKAQELYSKTSESQKIATENMIEWVKANKGAFETTEAYNAALKMLEAQLDKVSKVEAATSKLKVQLAQETFNALGAFNDAEINRINKLMNADINAVKKTSAYKRAQKRGDNNAMAQLEKDAMKATYPQRKKLAQQKLALGIADIALSTAVAMMKANKDYGWPASLIPMAMIAGIGAMQTAAAVASNPIPKFAQGGDFVTAGPQNIMVGDNPGGRERVQVTPLSSPNVAGPQEGGASITVNVSGNVLSQDFVEGELAENIKEAIRRGTDFGIS